MFRTVNIYKLTADALSLLGYQVKMQGTYGDDLPETFVTYQMISDSNGFSDNAPESKTTRVQAALYSTDPSIQQSASDSLDAIMLPAGFLRAGGKDLPFDPQTGHYGYACDYRYFEMEE